MIDYLNYLITGPNSDAVLFLVCIGMGLTIAYLIGRIES